jgi:electron transfer flavoprotein beta subunit
VALKILVCIKQTPDSTVRVKVGPDGRSIDAAGVTWAISAYDEYAVELALEHKDRDKESTVTVVSLGPARARDALRQALAMGADEAVLISGSSAEALAPLSVARALAKVVEEQKPDLVLCGRQASDDEEGFVGPAIAEILGWPCVTTVTKFAPAEGGVDVWKEIEGGHEVWRASGPAVLTVQKSEKEPRYPSLPGIMKAKKKEIPEKDPAALGIAAAAPAFEIAKMAPPPARGSGKIIKDGDAKAAAAQLAKLLREEAKVL